MQGNAAAEITCLAAIHGLVHGEHAKQRIDETIGRIRFMSAKVLIVEDEPNIVIPLQFSLEKNGYQISVAGSGEEALEIIPTFQPDLILLDIMLPGIDGYQVCESIRQDPISKATKIVFLSAMGRDIDVAKGMSLAADDYIVKPFSIMDVISKVGALLEDKN